MSAIAHLTESAPDRALLELRALHALAEAINRSSTLDVIYPETLQALRWITGADRAAVLLFDEASVMRFAAAEGLSETYRQKVEGHSPWAANEGDAQPILAPDPQREPSLACLHGLLQAEGIASLAFIPIAHQGRLLGKFMLYFDKPHEMPANDVRLALTVAEYLALAISRQRALEEVQRLNSELESRVAQRTRQLMQANRDMEAFCYSVSHDLRAPLRALDGFARILLEDIGTLLDDNDKSNLGRIIAASERMGLLMDDLLGLSRVGRAAMHLREVDLGGLAGAILQRQQAVEPQRQVASRIETGLVVRADAGLMRTALDHLLGNAWKYSGKQETALIEFGCREAAEEPGGKVYFIRDNGAGFDMRYATKLFSPFHRVHSPNEYAGTGIGLAIVQRIIQRHSGRIWAESEPGRGATFFFTLWQEEIPAELQTPALSHPSLRPSSRPA